MSLKDRFNTSNSATAKVEIKPENTELLQKTDEISASISLGVLDSLLEDEEINAIFVNGAKNIFIERKTKLHRSTLSFRDEIQLQNIIKKHSNDEECFIKFNHKTGINVFATMPPLTNASTINIKCYRDKFSTMENLEEQQVLSKEISMFLETLLKTEANVIIAGDKKTLKTTLLSALAKKAPINNRNINIDFKKEYEILKSGFTNFDLSEIEQKNTRQDILNAIFSTNPALVFINDYDFCADCVIKNVLDGFRGLYLNIEAKTKEEALNKITREILKCEPYLTYEEAKKNAYKLFDYVIFTENENDYKISSISEVSFNNDNCSLNDVFILNSDKTHSSVGYTPNLFLNSETDSINLNIFNSEYKHTYTQLPFADIRKDGLNPDVLKKFKKNMNKETFEQFEQKHKTIELTEQIPQKYKIAEEDEEQMKQNVEIVYDEEFMKKAQAKFDEVRRNLKNAD